LDVLSHYVHVSSPAGGLNVRSELKVKVSMPCGRKCYLQTVFLYFICFEVGSCCS